jgi:hypothetical protein
MWNWVRKALPIRASGFAAAGLCKRRAKRIYLLWINGSLPLPDC